MTNRSQRMLDFERDLRLISERLHKLEDHFEDDGSIARLAEDIHRLAMRLEALEKTRQVGDDRAE